MSLSIQYHDDLLGHAYHPDPEAITGLSRVPPVLREVIRDLLKAAREEWADDAWRLFDMYGDHRILTVRKWFISFTFRVKHCGALVAFLVGPRPQE